MKIDFIHAQQSDLLKIVSTYNSTVPSRLVTADLEPVSIESKQAWFDAHSSNRRPLWTIEVDGNYAGWMSFNSFYGRPAYDGTVEVSIYLEENARGKGLGKVCLQKASLGIAVDPDVDRLCFVCEDGSMFGEEYTLVAVADYVLSKQKGNTVSNMSSTKALKVKEKLLYWPLRKS